MESTKNLIEHHLRIASEKLSIHDMEEFSTMGISQKLFLSRTLVSQYLNELNKENKVVKINSRPVYYLSKAGLEHLLGMQIENRDFLNMNEFCNFISQKITILHDFTKAIGNNGSLEYCIEQMKAAVGYPPNGLHIMLYGKKGSGKRYLCHLLYEYLINQNLMDRQSQFLMLEIKDAKKDFYELLREVQDAKVPFKGLLYIRGIEMMSATSLEQLQEFLNDVSRKQDRTSIRIITSINEDNLEKLADALNYSIPIKVKVPSYLERSSEEKEAFVLRFFQKEEERAACHFQVSSIVFQTLIHNSTIKGIMELQDVIKNTCANAYIHNPDKKNCFVHLSDIPFTIYQYGDFSIRSGEKEEQFYSIGEWNKREKQDKMLMIFEELLALFEAYEASEFDWNTVLKKSKDVIVKYYDDIAFRSKMKHTKYESFANIVNQILKVGLQENQISIPRNCMFVLAQVILAEEDKQNAIHSWCKAHDRTLEHCLEILKKEVSLPYLLSLNLSERLYQQIQFKLNPINLLFLSLNIYFYNQDLDEKEIHGIILSHGYCTASSIADAVNHLLNHNVFEAIDMPLTTSFSDIEDQLNHHIELHPRWHSLILLVDMGSLEELGRCVRANIKVGVLNNITTGMALEVGTQMLQNYDIEEILPSVCEKSQCNYQLIQPKKKDKAILFTNASGIEVSRKVSNLFRSSLPKNISVKFIEVEFDKLMMNLEEDPIFHQYDVRLVVKSYQLHLKYCASVELEDIIDFSEIKKIDEILKSELSEEEIEQFNNQLLKNFSLQNIMENLTILNPKVLIEYVSETISELQRKLAVKFDSKIIVGLYIHISLLIERLVTQHPIDYVGDLKDFEIKQERFICITKECFHAILINYSVELPLSEIYYLYNYIHFGTRRKEPV